MKKRSDPQRQEHWAEVMRRWREGGQTVRAFCRAEGVRESAFYFWRRELTRRGREGIPGKNRTPARRASSRHGLGPAFLPVRVVEPRQSEAAHGVEILLQQGRAVRVPPGFDRQTLVEVLSLLEMRPC